jgi:hypothetical protein
MTSAKWCSLLSSIDARFVSPQFNVQTRFVNPQLSKERGWCGLNPPPNRIVNRLGAPQLAAGTSFHHAGTAAPPPREVARYLAKRVLDRKTGADYANDSSHNASLLYDISDL